MKSIDELMEGNASPVGDMRVSYGEVKLCQSGWSKGMWFIPIYKKNTHWYGPEQTVNQTAHLGSPDIWELYVKPKKMADKWKWVNMKTGRETSFFYSEEEQKINAPGYIRKLERTKQDFPADE